MNLRTIIGRCFPLALALLIFTGDALAEARFDGLQAQLSRDGFEAGWIEDIYGRNTVAFDLRSAVSYFRHREASLDYGQFTDAASIKKARAYLEAHAAALSRAEKKYGVDREVVTAILLVETRLGTYVGKRPTLNILSSLAALREEWVRDAAWTEMEKTPQLSQDRFDAWAKDKSGWAYRELKAFLTYAAREDLDPVAVMGSYAGAFGIAQFMPTSVLDYAADGNDDGKVNLLDHEDAIASVATYLKKNGWRPSMNRSQRAKVIYRYNHSDYYVEAILAIADKLNG
ncbi:MAG: lytic murein transglycosylase [Desulfobacterales bacterium]|nr:lytic murein transglycosylase [Desulfobacterales bacterium]